MAQTLALGLSTRTPIMDPTRTVAWPGARGVRTLAPVRPGDTIHVAGIRTLRAPSPCRASLWSSWTTPCATSGDELVTTIVNVLWEKEEP